MKKIKCCVRIEEDILEKIKDIAYEARIPVTKIMNDGLRICVEGLEDHNGGAYPRRPQNLHVSE